MDDRDVAAAIIRLATPAGGPAVRLRFGKVTQASPLLIALGGGDPVPSAHLGSYAPIAGDLLAVLQQGRQFLAIGTVVPPA